MSKVSPDLALLEPWGTGSSRSAEGGILGLPDSPLACGVHVCPWGASHQARMTAEPMAERAAPLLGLHGRSQTLVETA